MVKLNRIYTRTGDKGKTGLGDGTRVAKSALRIALLGVIDEANAAIGLARLQAGKKLDRLLAAIQNDLFDLGADICVPEKPRKKSPLRVTAAQVARLEREIDALNAKLEPLSSFVLPGGCAAAAHLHLARTVVRRAECLAVALAEKEPLNGEALRYLNRLSDHLFVAARIANAKGKKDVLWRPGAGR